MHELMSYRDYISGDALGYWKSASGFEVDFIVGDHTAIEVKSKRNVSPHDLRSLMALSEERKLKRLLCVCLESRSRTVGPIRVLPYQEFLRDLWKGNLA
jgi:predicted AAA+ superfamily ATPase